MLCARSLCVYIKVSPGAWMTCVSQMTATSPTPQQQNRWKGRRCLAAALIPQPAAYSRKTSVALFLTLVSPLSLQTPPNKPLLPPAATEATDFSAKLLNSVKKKKKRKKERNFPAWFSPPSDSEQTLLCFTPPNLQVAHSE